MLVAEEAMVTRPATRLQDAPGPRQCPATHRVENDVDLAHCVFKRTGLVVDHLGGTQAADEIEIMCRSGGNDVRSVQSRKLHCEGTDSAGATMNEHTFAPARSARGRATPAMR